MAQDDFKKWLVGLLEWLRVIVLAALSAAVVAGFNVLTNLVLKWQVPPEVNAVLVAALAAAGKAADRTVHEDPNTQANGILPF